MTKYRVEKERKKEKERRKNPVICGFFVCSLFLLWWFVCYWWLLFCNFSFVFRFTVVVVLCWWWGLFVCCCLGEEVRGFVVVFGGSVVWPMKFVFGFPLIMTVSLIIVRTDRCSKAVSFLQTSVGTHIAPP